MGSLGLKKSAQSFEKAPKWREIAGSGHTGYLADLLAQDPILLIKFQSRILLNDGIDQSKESFLVSK